MYQARTVIKSIATDKRLVSYGMLLPALHIAGILFIYKHLPEFDNVPHFWFGYLLSEYSSRGANSLNLQLRLIEKFQKHGWTKANFRQADFLVRLTGFLLIGGLLWEWLELVSSPLVGVVPDSFFDFPITLKNIDGALDIAMGIVGATLAFLIKHRAKFENKREEAPTATSALLREAPKPQPGFRLLLAATLMIE